MNIEQPLKRTDDTPETRELADKEELKRSEEIAYAEKPWREGFDKANLTPKEKQELNNIANKEGEKAGKEYDAKRKRQSLQGVDDQYLPQYEEMALHNMKQDFAEKVIEANAADEMINLSKGVITTQESVDEYNNEYKKKYNEDAKKLTPLEWVRYQQYKQAERKKLDFINKGIPDRLVERAFQENLNIASNALKNKDSQIIHLEGAIKNEVVGKNPDFEAVLKVAPQLKELQKERVILEKEFEKADGKSEKAVNEKKEIKKIVEAIAETEAGGKKENTPLEQETPKRTGDTSKISPKKETETKTSSSSSAETKSGGTVKRELPGWLKTLFEGIGGIALIVLGALFSFFEKKIPDKKKK